MQSQRTKTDHAYWYVFGKDRYHQNNEMERWCNEQIGKGGWTYDTPSTWDGMGGKVWVMHSMFGNTTFAFRYYTDFIYFLLRWHDAQEEDVN